jgi:hypothetical protein
MRSFEEIRQKIRELAYVKWEQAGKNGNQKYFWKQAELELFGPNGMRDGGYYLMNKNGKKVLVAPKFPAKEDCVFCN